MKISILGNGFVGRATNQFSNDIYVFDINNELCVPSGLKLEHTYDSDIIFVCLPTPMNKDGSVHLDIVENMVKKLKNHVSENCSIIVRSTVPPGTCDDLDVFFMPEFLTEKNYLNDFINNKFWILGKPQSATNIQIKNITNLIKNAKINHQINYDAINILNNKEAEMLKYFKNNFLAVKVSFCNEIHNFCREKNIDYDKVISHVCLDDRITNSHTNVPGHDGKYGFGGTCFPKDCHGLLAEFNKINLKSYVLQSAITRNETVDRKEQDWKNDKGRAVVD